MIPMVDLKAQHLSLREEINAGIQNVMESGQFLFGPNVAAFEREAAEYLGTRHAVACASGTDALTLSLRALGIGEGDEVITTALTFYATAEAICLAGARPVFADIDPHTYNIDPAEVERLITPSTRAILPVHLYGQPAAMDELKAIASRYGVYLIEDCAQSFGASYKGRLTGSLGDAGCFSFFPSKNLGAYGDGGLISTNDDALVEQLRALCNHGSFERHRHQLIGYNSRLDEIQAVVLRAKLPHIDQYNAARRERAKRYSAALRELPGVITPAEDPAGVHVYHQYTLLVPNREHMAEALGSQGVASAIHYPAPVHRQPVFAETCAGVSLPNAEHVARHCLSLPMYPDLTEEQAEKVIAAASEALATATS